MNAIEIKNLCKSYGDFSIKDLNLVLPEGCILGLAGENGAGKSTMLNAVAGDYGYEIARLKMKLNAVKGAFLIYGTRIKGLINSVNIKHCHSRSSLIPLSVFSLRRA